jgi:hypothetical protein
MHLVDLRKVAERSRCHCQQQKMVALIRGSYSVIRWWMNHASRRAERRARQKELVKLSSHDFLFLNSFQSICTLRNTTKQAAGCEDDASLVPPVMKRHGWKT